MWITGATCRPASYCASPASAGPLSSRRAGWKWSPVENVAEAAGGVGTPVVDGSGVVGRSGRKRIRWWETDPAARGRIAEGWMPMRGRLMWGLLGLALGAYLMANADSRTQHMVKQRSHALGRRMRKAAVRFSGRRSTASAAERVLEAGRDAVENTLHLLRVR